MSSIFACDLGLNRKTLSRNFFCCFVFRFREIFFNQHWRQMRASLILLFGKTKAFFGKDTARKKTAFLHTLLVENERETSKLKWGAMFFYKVEGHMPKLSSCGRGKNFGLKSHLRACCTQPFKNITPLGMNCLARATVTYTRSALVPNKSSMSEWSIAVEAYLRRWFR